MSAEEAVGAFAGCGCGLLMWLLGIIAPVVIVVWVLRGMGVL